MGAQPEGLVVDGLLTREDCTTFGFDEKRREFVKLLDRCVRTPNAIFFAAAALHQQQQHKQQQQQQQQLLLLLRSDFILLFTLSSSTSDCISVFKVESSGFRV